MTNALALANKLADKPTAQLMLNKQLLNAPLREKLDEVLNRENEYILKSVSDYGGREYFINKMKKQAAKNANKSSKL